MEGFDLSPYNSFCFQRWLQLNRTGREATFGGMGGLREEAIQAILHRYDANRVDIYETIISIETTMFDYLKKEEAKSKAQKQAESQRMNAMNSRSQPNRGKAQTYRAVPDRPTMKIPKS
tara:strand:- start:7754 stop:8110 length:357 start_codon:yes stop_codon:yes gene_type:complete